MTTTPRVMTLLSLVVLVTVSLTPATGAERPEKLYQTASQQFWNGRYNEALVTYRNIVRAYPEHDLYWDAKFGEARSLYKLGRLNRADDVFRKVQQRHPEKAVRGDALFSIVEIAILQDDIIRARNLLETFLDVYSDHPIREAARKQLSLLKQTPTPTPAQPESIKSSSPSGKPGQPRLKSSGQDEGKPQSLPPEPEVDTEPTSPGMRSPGDTLPEFPDDRSEVRPDTDSMTGTKSGRISPIEAGSSAGDTVSEETRMAQNKDTSGANPILVPPGITESTDTSPAQGKTIEQTPDTTVTQQPSTERSGTDTPVKTVSTANQAPEPGPGEDDMEEGSVEVLRETARRQEKAGKTSKAFETWRKVTRQPQARAKDYYRAARLSHELSNPSETTLKLLNKSIAMSDDPRGRFFLLKAQVLLEEGREDRASSVLGTFRSDYLNGASPSETARYHFLRGELLRASNRGDEAFFQYMRVLQTAPDSRWGTRAQTIIKNEL